MTKAVEIGVSIPTMSLPAAGERVRGVVRPIPVGSASSACTRALSALLTALAPPAAWALAEAAGALLEAAGALLEAAGWLEFWLEAQAASDRAPTRTASAAAIVRKKGRLGLIAASMNAEGRYGPGHGEITGR